MKFNHRHKITVGIQYINLVSFLSLILLLIVFIVISSTFTSQSEIKVKIPKTFTSDMIKEEYVISITSENVVYRNQKVTTLSELEKTLNNPISKNQQLLIKADRGASIGRIMDVWDLCRKIGIERINIATNQEN